MSISRITEIKSSSAVSFDDAMREGIARAQKTLRDVRGAWIWNQEALVDGKGEITGKDVADEGRMSNMLTIREVAKLLHVHPNTLRRWGNDGKIKAYRITARGDRRFKREDVARFLES